MPNDCPFYAHILMTLHNRERTILGFFPSPKSNQCALITDVGSPCIMELAQLTPNWRTCSRNPAVNERQASTPAEGVPVRAAWFARYADKAQAEAAKEEAKQAFIAEWIAANGDENDRAQFADGLLDRKEILRMIAADAFTRARLPEEYDYELCGKRSCPCGRVAVDTLPRTHYPTLRALKAVLPPNASATPQSVRECGCGGDAEICQCGDVEPNYAATISLPVGPFTFKRLVKLG